MSQVTARLNTSGMHCSSCSMLIDMTVSDLEGVVESKTDHATGVTDVTFDDEVIALETVLLAIRGVGYEVEPA